MDHSTLFVESLADPAAQAATALSPAHLSSSAADTSATGSSPCHLAPSLRTSLFMWNQPIIALNNLCSSFITYSADAAIIQRPEDLSMLHSQGPTQRSPRCSEAAAARNHFQVLRLRIAFSARSEGLRTPCPGLGMWHWQRLLCVCCFGWREGLCHR